MILPESIRRSVPLPGVVLLTVDRPEARNALTLAMVRGLAAAIEDAVADGATRALVLTGTGPHAFVAGGDVRELAAAPGRDAGRALRAPMEAALRVLERSGVPSIAALNGAALGGGAELAVACDFRIASEGASVAFRQVAMGLVTGWGGARRLVRLVGLANARRILLLGETVEPAAARAMGLVDEVLPADRVLPAALALATRLTEGAPLAVRSMKALLAAVADRPADEAAELERALFEAAWASEDRSEAMRAFVERRSPRWRGK